MTRRLGLVTIGQSPRSDVVDEIRPFLGSGVEIVEVGALDDLQASDTADLAPRPGESVLVTRLRDGGAVKVAKRHVEPLLERQLRVLAQSGTEIAALLCTDEFPDLEYPGLLVRPQRLLHHFLAAVAAGKRVGVVVPVPAQVEAAEQRWGFVGPHVRVEVASPYEDASGLKRVASVLGAWQAELVVLDCMGFTIGMKAEVRKTAGAPVVLPRGLLGHALAELLE